MKAPSPKTVIAAMSFLAVISVAVVDFGRTAPGEVIAAHARVDGLASSASCSTCHGGWTSTMTSSCLDCHGLIQAHIDGGLGLHGVLDAEVATNCAACHSEHHGAAFQAVNDLSFARAGVEDPQQFEHELIGFLMDGAHLELECTECHEHARDTVVPEGEHRYVGLVQACATCHEDVHDGAYLATCVVCHVQSSFQEPHYTGHDRFLGLVGAHADLECATCHGADTDHSVETLRGPAAARPAYRGCAECHDSPHASSFVTLAAESAGVRRGAALAGPAANVLCSSCHEPEHLTFDEDAVLLSAEEHAASGFPLALPHHGTGCDACHDPSLDYPQRYPGRDADTCAACHDDVHGGQFEGLAFERIAGADFAGGSVAERGCLVCHARTHFGPTTFDARAHDGTDLPLDGAHLAAECSACHAPSTNAPDGPRVFHGIDHRCETCHGDAHGGFFDELLVATPPTPEHGDCARCHNAAAFSPAADDAFDHTFWTGYELTGAHALAECSSCHELSGARDATGRRFGRIEDLFGSVSGCATCHDDVHEGRFDGGRRKAEVEGRRDCARCHSTASFRDLPHGFDHDRWTGWRLEDAHAEADCSACHAPLRRPDELGRTWGRAAGTTCAECHVSPHGDQFEAPRPKACVKCHESAKTFSVLAFDHDLESRFPLDEAHRAVGCAECHRPETSAGDETTIVRYRPISTECVDCHGVHEKTLRRRRRVR